MKIKVAGVEIEVSLKEHYLIVTLDRWLTFAEHVRRGYGKQNRLTDAKRGRSNQYEKDTDRNCALCHVVRIRELEHSIDIRKSTETSGLTSV